MSLATRCKRLVYLLHRWLGIAGCVLMLLWFVSGITLLFVGYPKLTPGERLAPMPALSVADCCVQPDALDARLHAGGVTLTSIRGAPHYVIGHGAGQRVFDAVSGTPASAVDANAALAAARSFAPGAQARHAGVVDEDRWTHSSRLNAHRPLHRVALSGSYTGDVYVSGTTGEVVLDAPLLQQRLNYVGAWLHWLYMFRTQSVDPVWTWTVIALSALGTLTALTGIVVGVWRWRFRARYANGSRSPYREPWMRWHHIAGLSFCAFVLAWVFSGLMSMNPLGVFTPAGPAPDRIAYRGAPAHAPALDHPDAILHALATQGFAAVELHWRQLGGRPYVLAFDAAAESRIVRADGPALDVLPHWPADEVLHAARTLLAAPARAHEVLHAPDLYYYPRHAEAMNGHLRRGLPALRVDFADAGKTRAYIDLSTGEVARTLASSQRVERWLFYFLHSWDVPVLLRQGTARDSALILLSLGGIVVSASGLCIGWRRLRHGARRTI